MTVSRRRFLRTWGALIVSVHAGSLCDRLAIAQGPFDTHPSHIDPTKLDSWIAVSGDGTVTAFTGKCDFGQGMLTAQTQLVAEELCVAIERVKLIQSDTAISPDEGTTSGSQSTPTNFNSRNLAQAAATAREALLQMAAQKLGLPLEQLTVVDGVVHSPDGRTIRYEQLIAGERFAIPVSPTAKRRSPEEWTVLGKAIPSLERVALMTGAFEFVHTLRVPGMLHGRVVRPPAMGAKLVGLDENSLQDIPGIIKLVTRENFVGIVAETQWQAIQAARQLKVKWKAGSALPAQRTFFATLRQLPSRDRLIVDSEDVELAMTRASSRLEATYSYPYQMHGSLGTSCAVAHVANGQATVWSATQSAYPTRSIVASLLGLPLEKVRVVYVRGSGCYGLNGADAVSFDAALLSHAVGRPVRVQLSRQDEMAWENFGSPCVIDQRAGIDSSGNILAWECENWTASRGGRPGYDQPGNVITGMLLGFKSENVQPGAAEKPAGALRNRDNAVPSYMAGCVQGSCTGLGGIRSERVMSHMVASPFFTGPLRSPIRLQNTFAHECFMDELAAQAQADPVDFRLRHLRHERMADAVRAAARAAAWESRPSPRGRVSLRGQITGRGIACVGYEGDNGYAALVAEVLVDLEAGRISPLKFFLALDCGPISNPDGLRNQSEGGILQGMSRTLVEEVTWNQMRITSTDWETYSSLHLDIEVPAIEIQLINRLGVPATGAGETAITLVAASIGNALFDATGARLREVPFTAERLRAGLAQRSH
ncbi:MAG: xanthine dehydrogenase family protein molybdopterin-binding subunit [Acidobacteria bacterium]|nr:xanthine dehydrogenase family protein molybdopterin-binding subunit [Acidobacteriota bacterium]